MFDFLHGDPPSFRRLLAAVEAEDWEAFATAAGSVAPSTAPLSAETQGACRQAARLLVEWDRAGPARA